MIAKKFWTKTKNNIRQDQETQILMQKLYIYEEGREKHSWGLRIMVNF